nr:MAG TPA: hypothetical protein [Caudoviricetes sp.]
MTQFLARSLMLIRLHRNKKKTTPTQLASFQYKKHSRDQARN